MTIKQTDMVRQLRRKLISDLGLRYSSFDNSWKYRQVIEITIPAVNLQHDPAEALKHVPQVFCSVVDQILSRYEEVLSHRRNQFKEQAKTDMN